MTFLADLIAKLFAAFLAYWAGERQRRDTAKALEEAGAFKAIAAGQQEAAERIAQARREEAKADAAHVSADDDSAFDTEFRRNG